MKRLIAVLIGILLGFLSFGQEDDLSVRKALKGFYIDGKVGQPFDIYIADTSLALILLRELSAYYTNTDDKTRYKSYESTVEIGIKSNLREVKEAALEQIIQSSYDSAFFIRERFSIVYPAFPKEYYSRKFINELKELLRDEDNVNPNLILLAGYLELKEEIPQLKNNYINTGKEFRNEFSTSKLKGIEFSTTLTLARLGDKESIKYALDKIGERPRFEVVKRHLDLVEYIKQPEAVDFLIGFLRSDEAIPAYHESESIKYAVYGLHSLTKMLLGFPIEKNSAKYYSENEIEIARDWVRLNANNYMINRETW